METLALVVSMVATAAAAVWALRSKLGDVEKALAVHVVEETSAREKLEGRVVRLERKRR